MDFDIILTCRVSIASVLRMSWFHLSMLRCYCHLSALTKQSSFPLQPQLSGFPDPPKTTMSSWNWTEKKTCTQLLKHSVEPNTNSAPEMLSACRKAETIPIIRAPTHMQAPQTFQKLSTMVTIKHTQQWCIIFMYLSQNIYLNYRIHDRIRIRPNIALHNKREILLELLKHLNKYLEWRQSVVMRSPLRCNPSPRWTSLACSTSFSLRVSIL